MMHRYNERFKDAPWFGESKKDLVMLGGVGGIGSNALYYLTKSTSCRFVIYDDDIVDEFNIGTQFFKPDNIEDTKVGALKTIMCSFGIESNRILTMNSRIKGNALPISIGAFDNMDARKQLFNNWKNIPDRELLIDGRLSATIYQVFVVTPGEREEWYEKTLFDDKDVADGPCTFKQTTHFAGLIGARITHILANYLSNKYMGEDVLNIPYLIEEYGDPFIIKCSYEHI